MKKDKVDTKELGLNAALILVNYFFKTEDLHYGYWTEDLEITIDNFAKAQAKHTEFVISRIPEGVTTVLDVGCGAGTLASKLLEQGFKVDCVSPSKLLSEKVRQKVGSKCKLFETRFEDLNSENKYDLVLFSESFQYVNLQLAIKKSFDLLNDDGHLLICDFFKTEVPGKSALGGGHKLSKFIDIISQYDLKNIDDIDITEQTAPNLRLINEMLNTVGLPLWEMLFYYFENSHPYVHKFLTWKFKKKISRINSRYFSGERNDENFKKFKSYRLFLYKKK